MSNNDDKLPPKHHEKKALQAPFVDLGGGVLAEEVYRNGTAVFAVWHPDTQTVTYEDQVCVGGKVFYPRQDEAIEKETVILATGAALNCPTTEELIDKIKTTIHKYVDVSPEFEEFAAWYVLLSWVHDMLNTLEYLRALGDYGTGKTRLEDVVGGLCYRPIFVSGATGAAPIFRLIEQWKGTLIIDESDFTDSTEHALIIKILNMGFEKGKNVIRCDSENYDRLHHHGVFGPKIIASRRTFDDQALESRCLTETMTPTLRTDIPVVLGKSWEKERAEMQELLMAWRFRHRAEIEQPESIELGQGLEPRLRQASIAFAALFLKSEGTMTRFKEFLRNYQRDLIEQRSTCVDGIVVKAIHDLVVEDKEQWDNEGPLITSSDISMLSGGESDRTIGKSLRSLKLASRQRRANNKNAKYLVANKEGLCRIFRRYILDCFDCIDCLECYAAWGPVAEAGVAANVPISTIHDETNETNETEKVNGTDPQPQAAASRNPSATSPSGKKPTGNLQIDTAWSEYQGTAKKPRPRVPEGELKHMSPAARRAWKQLAG